MKQIVEDLNLVPAAWAAYFRFGNSAARFEKIRSYARMRLALFISKRHRRSREFGWSVVTYQSPNQLGLVTLSGIVVDQALPGLARKAECRQVNGVGEPCAGEPHARFEAAGAGNGADLAKGTGVAQPTGKPAAAKAQPGPTAGRASRADILAPCGLVQIMHPDGVIGVARAARVAGTVSVLSTFSGAAPEANRAGAGVQAGSSSTPPIAASRKT